MVECVNELLNWWIRRLKHKVHKGLHKGHEEGNSGGVELW